MRHLLSCLFITTSAFASFVPGLPALNANDSARWGQIGSPGSSIPAVFTALSSGGVPIVGVFGRPTGGTVALVCPATNCDYASAPAYIPGDYLLWTEDAMGGPTGGLSLNFPSQVRGAGIFVELTAPGSFSVSFTSQTSGSAATELVSSDSNGDPVFVGVLDTTADIAAVRIAITSCVPISPGGCSTGDFAVDSLSLSAGTAVPEPASFTLLMPLLAVAVLLWSCGCRRRRHWVCYGACVAALAAGPTMLPAQDPIPFDPLQEQLYDGTQAVRRQMENDVFPAVSESAAATVPALPIWRYQIDSPVNFALYSGYMVGSSPFSRGARSNTVSTPLIPVIITFNNTSSGFSATFDPSSMPDAGCTANQTAMDLIENSPVFQKREWMLNGVYVGNTQYIDAYQRANFWQYVQNTGDAYHNLLAYSVADPLTISVQYSTPTNTAQVRVGLSSSCLNPSVPGATNGGAYEGIVDINTIRNAMTSYIATHPITADQFPIFILYNVIMSQNNQPTYYGGYHFKTAPYPQALTNPGQTYAVANFRTIGTGATDTAILTHEIAEWMDDPGGYNLAPPWGHIGQEQGCSNYLEVGDPLTGTTLPVVTGTNGFNYHLQELAFFSWFFRTTSIAASASFSNSGILATDAGTVCQ